MIRQWPGNVQTYGYCPGLRRRLELHRDRLARLDQLGKEQHLGNLRHVLLRHRRSGSSPARRPRCRSPASESGAPSRKLCCIASGLVNTISTSCPGATLSSVLSNFISPGVTVSRITTSGAALTTCSGSVPVVARGRRRRRPRAPRARRASCRALRHSSAARRDIARRRPERRRASPACTNIVSGVPRKPPSLRLFVIRTVIVLAPGFRTPAGSSYEGGTLPRPPPAGAAAPRPLPASLAQAVAAGRQPDSARCR